MPVDSAAIFDAQPNPLTPTTLGGKNLCVFVNGHGDVQVNDATVTKADVMTANGTVVHVVDRVLNPLGNAHHCYKQRPHGRRSYDEPSGKKKHAKRADRY